MLVCLCHGVNERTVVRLVQDGVDTVEGIGRRCGAGTGCGACVEEIEDLIAGSGEAGIDGVIDRVSCAVADPRASSQRLAPSRCSAQLVSLRSRPTTT